MSDRRGWREKTGVGWMGGGRWLEQTLWFNYVWWKWNGGNAGVAGKTAWRCVCAGGVLSAERIIAQHTHKQNEIDCTIYLFYSLHTHAHTHTHWPVACSCSLYRLETDQAANMLPVNCHPPTLPPIACGELWEKEVSQHGLARDGPWPPQPLPNYLAISSCALTRKRKLESVGESRQRLWIAALLDITVWFTKNIFFLQYQCNRVRNDEPIIRQLAAKLEKALKSQCTGSLRLKK